MERSIELWTVEQLQQNYGQIHFPEYQRDPNVWSRDAKQRLIDSMMREFDIAPLYFYTRENDVIDCVDGRQRIGAICPSSKQTGLLSVFHKGGSGSSLFDVKALGFDGSSGGFGWSVF